VAFFFVVFLVLGCFIPHDMILSPPFFFLLIDLFISFKLIFVKSFLHMKLAADKAGIQG